MNVCLFGATGMVGHGVLIECLEDETVSSLVAVGRQETGVAHPKLREVVQPDLFQSDGLRSALANVDACFFCLGTSSAGMDEAAYTRITYDLTLAIANVLASINPAMTFCYVSGEGTDGTERGRLMWARVKGRTENRLLALFPAAYMFRPGFIQPMKGARSKTAWVQAVYTVTAPLFPLVRGVFARHVTTTENMGLAMIEAAEKGYLKRVLENPDIDALAERRRARAGQATETPRHRDANA